ncbi:hypothetical protein K493DRAFT_319130 [Basidiobolus meristosporus CBS 931.73]|uniref:Uncharacterized protein n=1 Tax=Basidiobolus meristosporus CBS 931.73 TaxID=1314790 RepID=A0A1Y1XTR8_9FUNG|nr:hypothetical protein K493DRAFT_319130 [Basidiobolus meristosporus CBS 931.73]|eukprot:ORX88896.1 hypothetical protein K493DRAFT_319130 [Basidiobolus meristosporus CBS 931.73]
MHMSFLRRGRAPLSPAIPTFPTPGSNGCAILLVDSVYVSGTYHVTPYGSPQPSPTVEEHQSSFYSGEFANTQISRRSSRREAREATEFIQQLLETYKQVTAVASGNEAMSYLHSQPPAQFGYTILLVDLDHHTFNRDDNVYPSSYESGFEPKDTSNILYGIEFLKVVLKEIDLGIIADVIPIGSSISVCEQVF